jgi:hypothetical protein
MEYPRAIGYKRSGIATKARDMRQRLFDWFALASDFQNR